LTQLKVLYVEDDPDIRELAELSLQMDPTLEVRIAASGAEALQVLSAWKADVILLDVMMPQMDGPSLLAAIRSDAAGPQPHAVFITARALPAEVERLKALGALGVITKPFDALRLAREVRRLAEAA
jgi:CheY-like chemotaxis protein